MIIKLTSQQGKYTPGTIAEVFEVVLHGGNYDCDSQYRILDGTLVPSNACVVIDAGVHSTPPKPCLRRLTELIGITWCTLPDSHTGSCSGPPARVIETEALGPDGKGQWSPRRRW